MQYPFKVVLLNLSLPSVQKQLGLYSLKSVKGSYSLKILKNLSFDLNRKILSELLRNKFDLVNYINFKNLGTK